ncbi:MAG: PAC2 family protein [Candidatus Thermoplasmatota archaeon]|jgi:uncharacterized protein|nr:PAC2 family protein [Candidatus Thermoplasmatota archaeon]MCL5785603.1 PAC2 family protein [Candidatus Thermoplasmatota archaeon]
MAHDDIFQTKVVEVGKVKTDNAIVVCGFVGSTPAGVLAASYLVENKKLHECAHVRSMHIAPVTVFVGGKLRHPFRIYGQSDGKLLVVMSEIPIDSDGLYEVASSVMDWIEGQSVSELVMLEGIPTDQVPSVRKTYGVSNEEGLARLRAHKIEIADSALVTGMGGAIMSECLTRKIPAFSLLTPMYTGFPDPETVLALLQSMNGIYSMGIPLQNLEGQVQKMHEEMNRIMDNYKNIKQQDTGDTSGLYR